MEAIAVIAVVAVIALIIGFKPMTLVFAAAALLGLLFVLTALFFIYFLIQLILSHRKKAVFSRIGKSPYNRFNTAFYLIDGKEYPNVFPSEGFKEDKLYKSGKEYTVMLDRRGKYIFDRFSVTTCIAGSVFCIGITAGALFIFLI